MNDNPEKNEWEWLDRETSAFLYEYLTMGADIPEPVRKYFGFNEDYLLYEKINGMDCDEYLRRRQEGRLPDVLEVDARLTNAVEKAFESVCRRPPDPYLDRLNGELERLGRIAASPDSVHDIIHVTPSFLAKYGIDKGSPEEAISRQAEKAYRELDARFVRMTGRKPYADGFFHRLKEERTKVEMRGEVFSSLYGFMREGREIPPSVQEYCGFAEEYRTFEKIKEMDMELYGRKSRSGEMPDIDTAYAELVTAVEKAFEGICPRPPIPYLDRLGRELKSLKELAAFPGRIDGHPDYFLAKYGIERNAPEEVRRKQAEAASGRLDERFVRMMGGRSCAEAFLRGFKMERPAPGERGPRRKAPVKVRPKPKGRGRGL